MAPVRDEPEGSRKPLFFKLGKYAAIGLEFPSTVIGGLFLLGNLEVFRLEAIARLWPAVLVVLGVWLLRKHQGKAA